jgi:hypothetical protein
LFLQEKKILELLVSRGVCDGVRGKPDMSVDGFDVVSIHAKKLEKLFEVIKI